jgi:uncharacterized RDD family membrane protein YckC
MAETVRPKAQTAGILTRLLAGCYDAALLVGIGFLVFIPVSIVEQSVGAAPDWVKQLLFMTVAYSYFAGFWFKDGATTGMRPWKLRLAMVNSGDSVSLMAATVRFFGLMITWLAMFMTMLYLFGHYTGHPLFMVAAALPALSLLCMILTPRRQALHDLIAGTGVFRIKE